MSSAREIAARTEPRFIEIKPEPRRKVRLKASRFRVNVAVESALYEGRPHGHALRTDG
jgi:hypothetical protein